MFGVRDNDGHLIASAALLPYTSGNAWISMVLVTANWRRRGLATRLVDACLDAAAKQGLTTWLDATPAGATVYGPLGFTPTLQLRRLRLENATRPKADSASTLSACDLEEFIARDRLAMGFDRSTLLAELERTLRLAAVVERRCGCPRPRRPQGAAHRSVVCGSDPDQALRHGP